MAKVQAHVIYKGRVQGVGFRFTVEREALNLGITGWVKNLPKGEVEVVAEADEEMIKSFLGTIRGYYMKYIADEQINTSGATGSFDDFQVRF